MDHYSKIESAMYEYVNVDIRTVRAVISNNFMFYQRVLVELSI